jgi:tRNA nucleotidyltransferase/poly(A) polymerase
MAHLVTVVSPERIAAELRAMVSRPGRRRALELLHETGLAREVLPELLPADAAAGDATGWQEAARVVDALDEPELSAALAILTERLPADTTGRIASRLRLSNHEAKTARWLHEAVAAIGQDDGAALARRPWSGVQPWLAHPAAVVLADVLRARAACGRGDTAAARWVTEKLSLPRADLDPPPLLGGADLIAAGVPAGPPMGRLLAELRVLQLDGRIASRDDALAWVRGRAGG